MATNDGLPLNAQVLGRGAAMGAVAYLVGYLLTFLLVSLSGAGGQGGDSPVPGWKLVGWYFYNGHFVNLDVSGSFAGVAASDLSSLIAASDSATVQLVYVAPVVALLVASVILYRQVGPIEEISEAATAGALVVTGYLPLAVVGAVLTSYTGSISIFGLQVGSVTIQPQLLPAVVLAGLVYPLVFGALGAVGAARL
jgi:hypothetical protein